MNDKLPETKDVTEVVTCRAGGEPGCPMAVIDVKCVARKLGEMLDAPEIKRRLEERLSKPFNFHSQFCVAVTGCPNACAQPQIRDFAVIGRGNVEFDESLCNECALCEKACKEGALVLVEGKPVIDKERCIGCSDCVRACQSDALHVAGARHEVAVGGKLGRHPRLAEKVAEFGTPDEVAECLRRTIELLLAEGEKGERLGALLERLGRPPTSLL